jgi:2-dehydropantoate 2-reductase
MKIAILGSGAQGCLYGGFLIRAGHEVTFVARGEQLQALQQKGLTIIEGDQQSHHSVAVVDSPRKILECDLGIVSVKARDTAAILEHSGHLATSKATFFSVQNVGGKEELMAGFLGKEHVIGAVSMHGAVRTDPGSIRLTSAGRGIAWIGEYPAGESSRVNAIAAALTTAGLKCEPRNDISSVIWAKLIQFSTEAGICSVTRSPWYRVLKEPSLVKIVYRALSEGAQIAHAANIVLKPFPPLLDIERVADLSENEACNELLAKGSELEQRGFIHHRPSMLMDILRKRPTEVDDTIGHLVRRAAGLNIEAHTLQAIYGFIRGIEGSYDLN